MAQILFEPNWHPTLSRLYMLITDYNKSASVSMRSLVNRIELKCLLVTSCEVSVASRITAGFTWLHKEREVIAGATEWMWGTELVVIHAALLILSSDLLQTLVVKWDSSKAPVSDFAACKTIKQKGKFVI